MQHEAISEIKAKQLPHKIEKYINSTGSAIQSYSDVILVSCKCDFESFPF